MTDPRDSLFARAEPLAARALTYDPAMRDTWVSAACADDPELEAEVRTLLRLDAAAPDFLAGTALDDLAHADAEALSPEGLVGTHVGAYRLDAFIGSGGMSEVYRAIDDRLGRPVALKVLRDTDDERLQRFEREARTLGRIVHPNVVAVFEFGRDHGVAFLALELVEGESLATRLTRGPLAWRTAMHIGAQIARGLDAAHAEGVLHRDVKPANVMIAAGDVAKLVDFGIARGTASAPDMDAALTVAGGIVGTSGYMAPEQVRGDGVDARTDIFALGAVLYEMVAGQPPFARSTAADVHAAVLRDDPPALPPTVPHLLATIAMQCLEKAPDARYQSARDVALLLEAVADARRDTATVVVRPSSRRRWLAPAMALAVAIAAVAIGWRSGAARPVSFVGAPARQTFRRGTVFHGRFAPGAIGSGIVYSAAWEGGPSDVYESLGAREPRPRHLDGATLLAVAPDGELAVALGATRPTPLAEVGQLAMVPGSGAPRAIAPDVTSADVAPNGRLALTRRRDGDRPAWQLEWPAGTAIHAAPRLMTDVRVDRTGGRLAWLEHDTRTHVMLLTPSGPKELHATPSSTQPGLAWSPDGSELWFTAARSATLDDTEIRAVDLDGHVRPVLQEADGIRLLDVAADGRLLAATSRTSVELFVMDGQGTQQLGWLESSFVRDLSADGRTVLFTEDGAEGFDLYMRRLGGTPPVRIAQGVTQAVATLSPEQTRVAAVDRGGGVVWPVGAGPVLHLAADVAPVAWFPDGRRLLSWLEPGGVVSTVDLAQPTRSTSENLTCSKRPTLSPSGRRVACVTRDGLVVHELGGASRRLDMWSPVGQVTAWTSDERGLFGFDDGRLPQRLRRIDAATGQADDGRVIAPPDAAGVWRVRPLMTTPRGDVIAFSVHRRLDRVYLYRGGH